MSNELESIVRPSQTPDYAPAKRYFIPGQVGIPNVHLQIGRSGQGKMFQASFSSSVSVYADTTLNEKARQYQELTKKLVRAKTQAEAEQTYWAIQNIGNTQSG